MTKIPIILGIISVLFLIPAVNAGYSQTNDTGLDNFNNMFQCPSSNQTVISNIILIPKNLEDSYLNNFTLKFQNTGTGNPFDMGYKFWISNITYYSNGTFSEPANDTTALYYSGLGEITGDGTFAQTFSTSSINLPALDADERYVISFYINLIEECSGGSYRVTHGFKGEDANCVYSDDKAYLIRDDLESGSRTKIDCTGDASYFEPYIEIGTSATEEEYIEPVGNGTYYFWAKTKTCAVNSTDNYGALVCTIENLQIPYSCVNVTSRAFTTSILYDEENLNNTAYFSKWACNPTSSYCNYQYLTCDYPSFNGEVAQDYTYLSGAKAKAQFYLTSPTGCIVGDEATFGLIGTLYASCQTWNSTEAGVYIEETKGNCTISQTCYSGTQIIRTFPDCKTTLGECPYGCKNGACNEAPEITPSEQPLSPFGVAIPNLTPFTIFLGITLGIAGYIEYKVRSRGLAFIGVMIIMLFAGSMIKVGTPSTAIIPIWIPILFTIVAGLVAFKFLGKG